MKIMPFNQLSSIHFLNQQERVFSRVTERLSSGMRINSAADDPAGLALHSQFRARAHGLNAAIQNVEETITMFDVQDSVLSEIQDQLMRIRDLAVRASADAVLRDDCQDRSRMNEEVQALKQNIKNIAETTTFNTKQILVGNPVKEISVENVAALYSDGEHPTWDTGGDTVAFTLDDVAPGRYPAVEAYRIWSRDTTTLNLSMVTSDPDNAPADVDGDGYVDHPLSDPDDSDPDVPGGVDTDGDGWPDVTDPFPSDPAWPSSATDADGDGYVSHPDIDPDDSDPNVPIYSNTDADNDGYVDHPYMDPDPTNKSIPDVWFDRDGDGVPDLLDIWYSRSDLPVAPKDTDGDGEIDEYDPYPNDGALNSLNPIDNDGDGWVAGSGAGYDNDDNDPASPGGAAPDTDGDGVTDVHDPWPTEAAWNPANPKDSDGDGVYDKWDIGPGGEDWTNDPNYPLNLLDSDGDGAYDYADPDPLVHGDTDGDGVIDIYDPMPTDPNYPISTKDPANDADGDGFPDDVNGWFDPDPTTPNTPADFVDTDGDGWPDYYDPYPDRADIPGSGAAPDVDGDGFVDVDIFDPDPTDPNVPFDNSVDADGDKYPDYIDGGPGDPTGDDNNPYLPLTHISWEDRDADWGTGGMAFASNRNTPYTSAADPWVSDIFVYSDGQEIAITNDADIDEQPAWSADGKYLTWLRNGTDIYFIEMDGCQGATGTAQFLTAGENPVFDPNSTLVYYNNGGEIWYMDVNGGAAAALVDENGATITGDAPYFNPSGDLLWYDRGGTSYAFDLARKTEFEVTGVAGAANADLSPSGNQITYEFGGGIMLADVVIEYDPVNVQVGPDNTGNDVFEIIFPDARIGNLGIGLVSVESQETAEAAIDTVDEAIDIVSDMRNSIGSQRNRMTNTLNELYNQHMNILAAASSVGDADMAVETAEMARANILSSNSMAVTTQGMNINRHLSLDLIYENFQTMGF